MQRKTISDPAELVRLSATRGLKARGKESPVDRTGGKYGAGVVRGVSVITRGEALGHRSWIDETTLQQVADAINAAGDSGIKSRFTHPSVSGDGLGSLLGHVIGPAEVIDGQVVADGLHFTEASHNSPNGDLAGYTMTLAEESPEAFGTSIVFMHDQAAEDAFDAENQVEVETVDGKGRKSKRYEFRSPDPENVNNYRHVRLKSLRAVDAVDEPAANPSGLFTRGQEIPAKADAFLSFCLGLTSERPDVSEFGVDPDRAAAFVARFLESRGLSVKGERMSKEVVAAPEVRPDALAEAPAVVNAEAPAAPALTREQYAAELTKYTDAFGAEQGAKWFAEGKPMIECYAAHAKAQAEALKAANERAAASEKALADVRLGETKPAGTGGDPNGGRLSALPVRVRE